MVFASDAGLDGARAAVDRHFLCHGWLVGLAHPRHRQLEPSHRVRFHYRGLRNDNEMEIAPARRTKHPAITVGCVAALAGLLFTTSAQLARSPGTTTTSARQPVNLAQLVLSGAERNDQLESQLDQLTTQIDQLTAATLLPGVNEDPTLVVQEGAAVGSVPVSGPGVRVVLDDAPATAINIPGVMPDDLVIHQQDLQAVISALWAGGAEAMTLMGERVTMTSAFRCTGNVLLLHGRVFSPPFVVEAIGDPGRLSAEVMASEGVSIFLTYVEWLGLGFSLDVMPDLTMPAFVGTTLAAARLPDGIDPFR